MTIKDIAAQTGYSVGTISRVLNNQPNVSEKARKAIMDAAEASGFQLNANAKQLKQAHSNTILMVVKGTSNELFSSLVEALQARINETNHPLVVDYLDENSNEVLRAQQLCREKKPLGILFLGGNRENFLHNFDRIGVPCVLITGNGSDLPFPNLSSISTDDTWAAAQAIDHLISMGHRKIAVIGGDRAVSDTSLLRFQGCMEAFSRNGIAFDEEQDYESVRFSFADGYRAARNLLERGREFTAIFAMSDVMAIGAIRALREAGRNVPEDVSVIGFDGLAMGEYTVPTLTTIRQSVRELAGRSIDMLLENIHSSQPPRHEMIAAALEKRESTKKIQ
jgi:LacI family transcriptional regulator